VNDSAGRSLTLYYAARHSLAEAPRVDEAKEIRDRAVALIEYARQAKDKEMLADATEIKFRAERRAGEILAETPKSEGAREAGTNRGTTRFSTATASPRTLADWGLTKTQSAKWQKLAALSEDKFEIRVEHAKARVEGMTTSAPNYSKAEYHGENEWFMPGDYLALACNLRAPCPRSCG
jgi:hypothetical protein